MLDRQAPDPETKRFDALCAEVEEYDHLPEFTHDHEYPTELIIGQDHGADLDASILAGLVSP